MRVLSYKDVLGEGLKDKVKSFNVQCFCDVRNFECIAKYLVDCGMDLPVRGSTVLNEVINWMSEMVVRQEKGRILQTPQEAIDSLKEMGVSMAQFEDRRGRAIVRHLQKGELAFEHRLNVGLVDESDVQRAIEMMSEEPEDMSALSASPGGVAEEEGESYPKIRDKE